MKETFLVTKISLKTILKPISRSSVSIKKEKEPLLETEMAASGSSGWKTVGTDVSVLTGAQYMSLSFKADSAGTGSFANIPTVDITFS